MPQRLKGGMYLFKVGGWLGVLEVKNGREMWFCLIFPVSWAFDFNAINVVAFLYKKNTKIKMKWVLQDKVEADRSGLWVLEEVLRDFNGGEQAAAEGGARA